MSLKTSLLAVATVATATTAQAADLPVAPEPVDYVRICDAYGARFYYIPGTETCLRVGGRVRTTFTANDFSDDSAAWGGRTSDGYTWTTEGFIYLDANTATEFGTLRTFVELEGNVSNGTEAFDMNNAFIQWGGLTAGYLGSQFDHYTGQVFIGSITRNWSDTTTQQLSYTASFGNGFYVTGSVEDRKERDNNTTLNTFVTGTTLGVASTTTVLSSASSGARVPDFVGAIGVSQGWGAAKLSGALHQVYPAVTNQVNGGSEDDMGWAVGASVLFNLDMLSSGSNIFFQGMYADGALSYIGVSGAATGPTAGAWDSDNAGNTASGYSLSSGIYYQATSTIGLALDGSWADVDGAGTVGVGAGYNDFTRWAIDGSVQWEPVSGLLIGGNVGYSDLDRSNQTTNEGDTWVAGVRIQRTF